MQIDVNSNSASNNNQRGGGPEIKDNGDKSHRLQWQPQQYLTRWWMQPNVGTLSAFDKRREIEVRTYLQLSETYQHLCKPSK